MICSSPISPSRGWVQPTRFSTAHASGVRRTLEIPNPFIQYLISQECSKNWRTLQRLTALSPISLSRPLLGGSERSLRHQTPISEWRRSLISRMPGGRVTLKTDISQFYSSVYTHAVDWSIRGKRRAKEDSGNRKNRNKKNRSKIDELGAGLDKLLSSSRHGQTVGLSIGPDTSWLVAEVMLARVDSELAKRFPQAIRRTARFGDDMTVYASSIGEAEEILSTYQFLLREYELAINPVKVAILDGLDRIDTPWVRRLRYHRYRDDTDAHLTSDIIDIFDLAFEEKRGNPASPVLSYAIKRCNPFPAGPDSWPIYRDLVLASIGIEPSSLPQVHAVLEFAHRHGLIVDKSRVGDILNELILYHARLEHGFETSWMLYIIRSLDLELDSESANAVSEMEDNCSLIILGDLHHRSAKLQKRVSLEKAVRRAEKSESLKSNDWLLAYEYRHNHWCLPKKWDSDPAWKELHRTGVGFYMKTSLPPQKVLQRKKPRFVSSWRYGP